MPVFSRLISIALRVGEIGFAAVSISTPFKPIYLSMLHIKLTYNQTRLRSLLVSSAPIFALSPDPAPGQNPAGYTPK